MSKTSLTITPSAYEYVKTRRDANAEFLIGFREDLEALTTCIPETEEERLQVEFLIVSTRRAIADLEGVVAIADRLLAHMRSNLGMSEDQR
jgi:hypothetical protein